MGWFAVQLSEQECFQVPLESKETLAGTKFLWQFVPQAWCSTSKGPVSTGNQPAMWLLQQQPIR
jgi:hypothetical protein